MTPASNTPSMRPYYDDGTVTIYHGDCRELLPQLKADAIFADPPYGVNIDYGNWSDSPEYVEELALSAFPLMRAAAPVVAITPGTVNVWRWPATPSVLGWLHFTHLALKGNKSTARFTAQRSWQPILVYGDRWAVIRSDFYASEAQNPVDTSGHPCAKPLHFCNWIVRRITEGPGTIVLDPFAGSGTTLRAAKDLGRKAIGIELEERFCEMAALRCAQEVMEFAA